MSKSRYCRIVCTICAFAALAALPLGATAEESHRQSFDLGVEYDQELLHEEPACDLSDPAVVGTCGVSDSIDQCRWQPFKQAIDGGLCDTLVDPVERHVCRKGILLDGHLDDGLGVTGQCEYRTCGIEIGETPCPRSYFEAERAVAHVDQLATSDASGISDDPYDDCPSGFNVGCSLLWFEPDTDPMDGVDDSFLYVAWDVADPDVCGIFPGPPVQYDADVDGSACESQRIGFDERHNEDYELGLLSCDDLTRFDPNNATTNSVTLGPELSLVMEIQETGFEWDRTYLTTSDGTVLDTLSFPTADNATNPTNACIDNEIDFCAYRCSISGRPCVNGEACPAGEGTCDDLGNNVELVIKAVETSGVFGPHGRECIGNSAPCFSNYHCPGGGGGVCASTAAADSPEARENRFALAQLAAELRADSERDNSSEEQALVAQFTSLPGIEVKKLVRCVDPVGVFAEHAVALPGSKVEFEITIENTGNEDLSVTVQDVLTPISNKVSCEPVSETLEAFLTSPRRGLVSHEIRRNTADAISPPVCNPVIDETECLNVQFFVDLEVAPAQGFLGSIRNDETEALGTLLGVTLNRSTGECLFDPGDVMVVRFECLVNTSGVSTVSDLCDDPQTEDCTNAVTVSAPLLPPVAVTLGDSCPGGQHSECDDGLYCNGEEQCLGNVCQAGTLPCLLSEGCNEFTDSCGSIAVSDVADIIDTDREFVADDDDNVATVDLLCRDIDFVKEVQLDDSGVWKTGDDALNIPNGPFPLQIEYRYTVTNTGEIDEEVTLTDEFLCADLTAIAGVSYVTGQCDICELGTPGELVDTVPANSSRSYNCQVELTEAGLQEFLEQDDTGRPDCTAGAGDADCYRNCANISAEGMPLTGTCDSTPAIELESFSTICNQTCEITVIKEVRCQEDCSTLLPDSEDGWVGHPDELDVAPGACVQYRITVENIGDDPLCAIEIIDCMVNSNNFASGPDQVQVVPPICTLTPPFNWDCDPFRCDPDPLLQAGDKVKILFMGRLKDKDNFIPNRDPLNVVDVRGALEGDCAGAEPNYSCDDDSTVGVDIQECSFTVEKSVTCDDPVVCNGCVPECVDALPGSTNGFRIEICNTGETNISTVGITDVLECESWYIGGSVNAFITNGGGTDDVTSCICETDACPTFDQINGVKGFKDCRPGSPYIPTGECLVITFKVEVPAVDPPDSCTNSVTVTADTDICEASDKNPCGVHSDDACIKVKEPDIECDKSVCLDENQNDECDEPDEPETDNLQLPCDIAFPFNLVYNFEVCNTGETPLINVRACDPDLVAHAVACGLLVGPCDLCDDPPPCDGNNDVCCEAPDLDPGECHTCRCTVQVPDRDAWECFAASDGGDENCHTNGAVANGDVDTSGLCSHGAETVVAADCGDVEVCLAPECEIEVTKQVQCLSSCLPEAPPIGALTDLLEVTPGSCVRYVIDIKNTSPDVPVCCVSIKDWLDPCVTLEPGTTQCSLEGQPCNACPLVATDGTPIEWCFENCPGTNNVLDPGETARIVFTGRMVCTNGFAQNRVEVEGATSCPVSAAPVYCCEDSSSCGVDIKDCSFTVDKDVTCDDPTDPNAVFQDDLVDALPGEEIGFRISICNTGDTNISTVGLDDDLGCEAWYVGGSVDAFITDGGGKDDVTTCVCETDACPTFGSLKELIDFKDCRPAAPYIPPGECLVISFRVKVPEVNPYPDECCNTATVTAKTDICEATEADPCGQEADTACINVLEPGIACDKEVTADYGNNSSIDDGPTSDLTIPDLAEYPIALVYELTVENTGDVALHGAKICDEELVSDALDPDVVAAGITIGACDLCEVPCDDGINDTCAELGDIPAGETRTATCKIIIPDRDAFDVWELTDGVEDDQYCNKAIGHGTVEVDDVTTCGPETPEEIMSGPCITCVRVPRPVTRCYPRVKARVTAWNQEETLFTGLHHCITQWDQTPLSLYGQELGAPNYMTREFLQTDKGVARIEGMASGYCDTDGYVSEDAPLIGVAHKQLRLEQNPPLTRLDATGMHLIGMSTEIGSLRYTLDAGGGEKRGASADSPADGLHDAPLMGPTESGTISGSASTTPHPLMAAPANLTDVRGGITQKGSLIVFPKVELRWRFIENQWTLIQDTFLDLTNDNEDEVDVLIYYVNGDEPMAATNGEREHRGCNFEPISKTLTGNQPAYWSAYTGMPGPDGTSMPSWTLLDPGPADQPGRPANDGSNDRVLRGYVLVWAVDDFGDGDREISWNHLKGDALLINYVDLTAWEYNTWAFQSVDPAVQLGEATGTPGTLLLDGEEYEIVPGQLLLDFYASGTVLPFNQQQGWSVKVVDTDLTLLPMLQDLRQR